jgi:hypothetical protein
MPYDKKKLEKQSLEAIAKHKLFFIDDIISYLPCSRATFYNYGLDKLDTIKDELTKQKTELKVAMRSKWYKSDNATLQMGLMKLVSTDEELRKLSMNHNEHTTNGKDMTSFVIELSTDNETNTKTNTSI